MSRPWKTLGVVGLCLAVVFATMAWMSHTVLTLDRAEEDALYNAALEESVRLSLWRMDSALAPIIARESARPPFIYQAFYPAAHARSLMSPEAQEGDATVPSPLLTERCPYVLLHFEIDAEQGVTSPQVPGDGEGHQRAQQFATAEELGSWSGRLGTIRGFLDLDSVAVALAASQQDTLLALSVPEDRTTVTRYEPVRATKKKMDPPPAPDPPQPDPPQPQPEESAPQAVAEFNKLADRQQADRAEQMAQLADNNQFNPANMEQRKHAQDVVSRNLDNEASAPAQVAQQRYSRGGDQQAAVPIFNQQVEPEPQEEFNEDAQVLLNAQEFMERSSIANDTIVLQQTAVNYYMPPTELVTGYVVPLWMGDQLLLLRRVSVSGTERIQGCWIDWPAMERGLLDDIRDLLPGASLEPVSTGTIDEHGRMLAALPIRLIPGELPPVVTPISSPIRTSLGVAWLGIIVAVTAVLILLAGTLSLSERRAAFVSAVTHEMRTPLTTFRMYTEMLAAGMVTGEKRAQYLETLQREADRLGHLVDNVLAYARLEKGTSPRQLAAVPVAELLGRVQARLEDRAAQAGRVLVVETGEEPDLAVRADVAAVEQILLNLVDNSCKYAADADDPTIHLAIHARGRRVAIQVRDHGPGIDPPDRNLLFEPFTKSAKDAAGTAPGVGLGLSLCRRLARDMKGDLLLDRSTTDGAAFQLVLKRTS